MVKLLTLSDSEEWNNYLTQLPDNCIDIYYTPEYYSLYEANGDGLAKCFVFINEKGLALYPFLLNKIPSKYDLSEIYYDIQGAYGYNGVVASCLEISFIQAFYKEFEAFCRENKIVADFTRFNPILENYNFSNGNMTVLLDRNTVALNLNNTLDEIWKESYTSNNRNMIRKAEKNGVTIEVSDKDEDYQTFYEIYTETMGNVNASDFYFFNRNYFFNFKSILKDNHKLLVAKYEGQIICAMLLMYKGHYAHYHLSGRKVEFSKLAANNLMLHEAIKISKELGCKYFHFGGGTNATEDDFLFKFKSNFSKEIAAFKIGKKIHNQLIYSEIVAAWEIENPEKINSKLLLKYRD